jgi:hypothetical protein
MFSEAKFSSCQDYLHGTAGIDRKMRASAEVALQDSASTASPILRPLQGNPVQLLAAGLGGNLPSRIPSSTFTNNK